MIQKEPIPIRFAYICQSVYMDGTVVVRYEPYVIHYNIPPYPCLFWDVEVNMFIPFHSDMLLIPRKDFLTGESSKRPSEQAVSCWIYGIQLRERTGEI